MPLFFTTGTSIQDKTCWLTQPWVPNTAWPRVFPSKLKSRKTERQKQSEVEKR